MDTIPFMLFRRKKFTSRTRNRGKIAFREP